MHSDPHSNGMERYLFLLGGTFIGPPLRCLCHHRAKIGLVLEENLLSAPFYSASFYMWGNGCAFVLTLP